MSLFRVRLNNTEQGKLDVHPTTGYQLATSRQRQVYIMGPGKTNRLLSDGETFTDCNYYKRYAYPQVPLSEAIVTVVTDDGSIWSDDPNENTYPKTYSLSCNAGSVFADNEADILVDTGGWAVFVQLSNTHATQDVTVRLNGVSDATFTLEHASVQVFNAGDLQVTKVEVANDGSGALGPVVVEVLCSIRSVCNS